MKHFKQEWIEEWCVLHGWTDLYVERQGNYWAFPPGAVMPEPIPVSVLRSIKAMKGMSPFEQKLTCLGFVITIAAVILSFVLHSPMPVTIAFAIVALITASLEPEYAY
ncbi:MAG: hypothetical protein ACK4QL_02385 [Pseudanabaenaceae cyanobacterium]